MALKLSLRGVSAKWWRMAGSRFSAGLQKIAAAAAAFNIGPKNLASLGSMKLHGLAGKEYSETIKNFNEAEIARLSADLSGRILESKVLQAEAEAHTAQVTSIQAELILRRQLGELGYELAVSKTGRLSIRELPSAALRLSEGQSIISSETASKLKGSR